MSIEREVPPEVRLAQLTSEIKEKQKDLFEIHKRKYLDIMAGYTQYLEERGFRREGDDPENDMTNYHEFHLVAESSIPLEVADRMKLRFREGCGFIDYLRSINVE